MLSNKRPKPGDTFVLCDCGGGTVDLITYEVKETEPYLKLGEAVEGSGTIQYTQDTAYSTGQS